MGKRKCSTKYCRNTVIPSRDGRFCSTCRTHKYKKKNPFKYHFHRFKNNAKRRGKSFQICLEQYMLIWLCEIEKWEEKINGPDNCTWEMDRIKENGPYSFDNIQLIKKRKNVQKYYNQQNKFQLEVNWVEDTPHESPEAPF